MNGLDYIEGQGQKEIYICSETGKTFSNLKPLWRNPKTDSHLLLPLSDGLRPDEIDTKERSIWRYSKAIRVERDKAVSLGEGLTPLVKDCWNGINIKMKLEYFSPSGSFKDRGSSVMISHLMSRGVREIFLDSSGNAGSSVALYAALAKIACTILVPSSTSKGKITQMQLFGANVVPIEGSREQVAKTALEKAKSIFYASHNWQPFFLEGTKTLAYEIWEQLDFTEPDAVIVPFGYGSNLIGPYMGFRELKLAGLINNIPRFFAVQSANCAPLHLAYKTGKDVAGKIDVIPTAAEGIASTKPIRSREALSIIRSTGGCTISVSEDQIWDGVKRLAKMGYFVEPTCATVASALDYLISEKKLRNNEKIVVVLTGSGLKTIDKFKN